MTKPTLHRRHAMAGLGAAFMTATTGPAIASPTPGADIEQRLSRLQKDGRVRGIDALLVAKGQQLVFEHYETNDDEIWGVPNGRVTFGPTVLHDLRSVSKSVVGLLYGIALADGKVPPPEAGLYDQFPEYPDLAKQPGRERIKIAHVLSMTLGLEWDELTFPYSDARNSEIKMEAAPDRYRYILSLPIVGEPGAKWTYCGGATALLGRLIAKGTGEKLTDYARRVLFDPLGLGPTQWSIDDNGEPRAASGGRMRPPDLLRVGQMVQAKGAWQGKQIVPAEWLKQATTPAVTIEGPARYGWHWYLRDAPAGAPPSARTISAVGWGGQRLFILPGLDLVVAMNAGNYRRTGAEQRRVADALLTELVLLSVI